ncbi:MAG: hypothetical protein HC905_01410 [Bacteroidales bacterium]|nr:hypothetical protein [Bacteroidales bacterium]
MNNLNYGVIGNGRSAALISSKGSIDWCCLPDFDSPSVFAGILDSEKGGSFRIDVDNTYSITQKYFRRTNVLCTQFESAMVCLRLLILCPGIKQATMLTLRHQRYTVISDTNQVLQLLK